MGTTYTPGPWYDDGQNGVCARTTVCERTIAHVLGNTVRQGEEQGDITVDQRRANARLIAASPDLVEVVKAFVQMVDDDTIKVGNYDRPRLVAVLTNAHKAVAKAEGK